MIQNNWRALISIPDARKSVAPALQQALAKCDQKSFAENPVLVTCTLGNRMNKRSNFEAPIRHQPMWMMASISTSLPNGSAATPIAARAG